MSRYSHLLQTPEALVRLLEQRDREDTLRFGLRWDRDPDGTRASEEARRAGEVALLTVQPELAFGAPKGAPGVAGNGQEAGTGTGSRRGAAGAASPRAVVEAEAGAGAGAGGSGQAAGSVSSRLEHLLIEGDNRDALEALRRTHQGRIRAVLIDPPYNTGNGDFIYKDRFMDKDDRWKHSRWLTFMEDRLVLIRDLLRDDGVCLIHISEDEAAYLTVLCDRIFGDLRGPTEARWGRLGSFAWRTRGGAQDGGTLFSQDHEYVLCYAGPQFMFAGLAKDDGLYSNPDGDPRGAWKSGDLTTPVAYTDKRAGQGYYPIQNPATGFWYPCSPDRVWAFASERLLKEGQTTKADTMEARIRDGRILWPKNDAAVTYKTKAELLAALAEGKGPQTRTGIPLLRPELPDLDFWVGKPIGLGRPTQKSFFNNLRRTEKPISSWVLARGDIQAAIAAANRSDDEETGLEEDGEASEAPVERSSGASVGKALDGLASRGLISGDGREGAKGLKGILHDMPKAFNYPKPLSLTQALVAQVTRPHGDPVTGEPDIVLDCFAGSGTTGHAVLAQNAQDGGNRQVILVCATEATAEAPAKNVCRTVTRERLRRVSEGYTNAKRKAVPGLGGHFAYLVASRASRLTLRPKGTEAWVWTAIQMAAGLSPEGLPDPSVRVATRDLPDGSVLAWVRSWTGASLEDQAAIQELAQTRPVVCWTTVPALVEQAVIATPAPVSIQALPGGLPGFGVDRPLSGAALQAALNWVSHGLGGSDFSCRLQASTK